MGENGCNCCKFLFQFPDVICIIPFVFFLPLLEVWRSSGTVNSAAKLKNQGKGEFMMILPSVSLPA